MKSIQPPPAAAALGVTMVQFEASDFPGGAGRLSPSVEARMALDAVARAVTMAAPGDRIGVMQESARGLRRFVRDRILDPGVVTDKFYAVADMHGLSGPAIAAIVRLAISDDQAEPEAAAVASDAIEPFPGDTPLNDSEIKQVEADDEPLSIPPSADGERDLEAEAGVTQKKAAQDKGEANETKPPKPAPLLFESAASWRGLPLEPMRYLATNRIPASDVTILSGDGGQGKTTIAMQLAVAVAADLGDWLGTTCEQGAVMFFSGEESRHTLRLKLKAICTARGVDPDDLAGLSFCFPEDPLLGTARKDGTIGPTPQMLAFEAAVMAARPALVIIDSVAAVFGGNYIDRVQVRTFVSMLRKVAETAGCAVLLLDHPSLSGMTNGSGRSGSMDWRNAVRAFMYLRPTDNDDGSKGRELEVMKINSGAPGEIQKLRWEAGCFVLESSANTSAPHRAAAASSADQAYLACLDATAAQGRNVYPLPGRGYAPKVFAEMPQAEGMTAQVMFKAQERLFAAGQIGNVQFGKPCKETFRIERISQA